MIKQIIKIPNRTSKTLFDNLSFSDKQNKIIKKNNKYIV